MKPSYLLLFLFLLADSCLQISPIISEMKDIESIIQSEPTEALTKLYEIDGESFQGAEARGLYALLFSMALDKNYIDLQSDSIIAPAVAYYSRHGDKRHRFLTYYYQGRIYENAKAYEDALKAFIKAEGFISKSVSGEEVVRLYCAKQRVYQHQFEDKKAYFEILKAKEVSRNIENPEFYFRNSLDLASYYHKHGEILKYKTELDSLQEWMSGKQLHHASDLFKQITWNYLVSENPQKDSVATLFDRYLSACAIENAQYDHLLATSAYIAMDEKGLAVKEFAYCSESGSDYDDILYYDTESELYQMLGNAEKALEARYKHETAVERISLDVFNNDVRFLEERYKTALQKQKDFYIKTWLALLAIILLGLAVFGIARMANYRTAFKKAQEEYDLITEMVQTGDENLKAVLEERLQALRPYITSKRIMPVIPGRKGLEKMDEDRKNMLRSIGMIYAMTYPKFVSVLAGHKLTPEEIGMCSLYVSGYSSKELADLLNRGDIYHLNSSIRAKIGDELSSSRLHSWLKETFNDARRS